MSSDPDERSGGCLCGAVTYRATGPFSDVLQCHCTNCRRLSGNFVAAIRAATENLVVEDLQDSFRWHELGYAKYAFCGRCGSTLFYRAADREHTTSVMVGTLDDTAGLELGAVWFADEAQPHNTLPAGVPLHDGNA